MLLADMRTTTLPPYFFWAVEFNCIKLHVTECHSFVVTPINLTNLLFNSKLLTKVGNLACFLHGTIVNFLRWTYIWAYCLRHCEVLSFASKIATIKSMTWVDQLVLWLPSTNIGAPILLWKWQLYWRCWNTIVIKLISTNLKTFYAWFLLICSIWAWSLSWIF